MSHQRLSLFAAILININIMIGSGIFINTVLLARMAGLYGAAAYALVGLLILPLMLCFSRLSTLHKGGSLYTYGAALHPYVGFLSTWGFFNTRLASCSVALYVSASMLCTLCPFVPCLSPLIVAISMVALFGLLNSYHVQVGKRIQALFVTGKMIPVVWVFCTAWWLFSGDSLVAPSTEQLIGVVTGIPFVLYAFMGFESSCAINHKIENPEKNAPRAIFIAYIMGVAITMLFQFMLWCSVPQLASLESYLDVFPALLQQLGITGSLFTLFKVLLHAGIATSAAGTAFGIMYTNAWNLYELAERGHVCGRSWLRELNVHHIPARVVLVEVMGIMFYLIGGQGNLPLLQQLAACGVTLTYSMSVVSLLMRPGEGRWLPVLGMGSCVLLFGACMRNFVLFGIAPLILLVLIVVVGTGMFFRRQDRASAV